MSIVFAREMGFCMGVRRAVALLEKALREDPENPPATYGPLVHNPRLLEEFVDRGVRILSSPDELTPQDRVLIRAHGVSGKIRQALCASGAELIDATCPKVVASMRLARAAERDGRRVVLAGDAGHGEMEAVAGALDDPESAPVVATADEVLRLKIDGPVSLIAQTTFEEGRLRDILKALSGKTDDLSVHHTICSATEARQSALRDLAQACDAIIVVGGRNSANTRRLWELAREYGLPAWHIESAKELDSGIRRYPRLGISAGASTPQSAIDEVARRAEELRGEEIE